MKQKYNICLVEIIERVEIFQEASASSVWGVRNMSMMHVLYVQCVYLLFIICYMLIHVVFYYHVCDSIIMHPMGTIQLYRIVGKVLENCTRVLE